MKKGHKWFAFDPIAFEHETFFTEQEAKDWVIKQVEEDRAAEEGYSEEAMYGGYFIGRITHETGYKVLEKRSDYDCDEGACDDCDKDPDVCGKRAWEYSNDHSEIVDIVIKEVD